jgi:hypothetical protein
MQVSIGTRNIDQTHQVLKDVFEQHEFSSELRQLQREVEGEPGVIVYQLIIAATVSTDKLAEEILSVDAANITSLEWDQKKSTTYIYR